MQIQLWTSSSNQPNHFFIHVPQKWFYSINIFLKRDLFFWNLFLIDSSAVDTSNYKITNSSFNHFLKNNQLVVFYVYYCYFLKIKLNISLFYDIFTKKPFHSIDSIFQNANWIERETSEMFGLNYCLKKDLRKLLIDYSSFDNPMLKSFPSEGFFDVFYNFFDDQVTSSESSIVEL